MTCDAFGKPNTPHQNIWVTMLRGYCCCLDPSIDNTYAQWALMNEMNNKLKEDWEYIGYDLLYQKFKT